MSTSDDAILAGYLYAALNSEFGRELDCEGKPEAVRQKLYRLRRENPDFQSLSFSISPEDPSKLWIVRTDNGARETGRDETHD